MKHKIKDIGIIYRIINYGDSSLIISVLCREIGNIAILAKGMRTKSNNGSVSVLNEYEFIVYEPSEPGLYLLSEYSLIHEVVYNNRAESMATASCGLELVSSLLLGHDEHVMYYELIKKYLTYLEQVSKGMIALFWRFAIRVFQFQGIDINLSECSWCKKAGHIASGIDINNGNPLCEDCLMDNVRELNRYHLDPSTVQILIILPSIGNHLDSIHINKQNVFDMDTILKAYYEHHFQKSFKLRSLSVLEQFYF